jgi:membrane protein involved in colicin uptake
MVYSEVKNEYGFSAEDVRKYREQTGAGMIEAKMYFMDIYHRKQKAEMVKLIESGTLEDIRKVVSILVERF